MLEIDVYAAIAAVSCLIILSYVFTLISKKTRISSVILLLILGIVIREITLYYGWYTEVPFKLIQFLGVLGLIVILLEAGLDLRLSKSKLPLIKSALASSFFVLSLSIISIGAVLYYLLDRSILSSLVYAIPLSIISSSIVVSSIDYLSKENREFFTYESSLSDIIGVLLFNFLIATSGSFILSRVITDVISLVGALFISLIIAIGLIILLARINSDIKAFLIFAVLLLVYSLGHIGHFPALLVVLIFGLIINNWRGKYISWFKKIIDANDVKDANKTIKSVTAESAFLIKTIFFTLFGYTIDIRQLTDSTVIIVGLCIITAIYVVRLLYLKLLSNEKILPALFFAPRGLITVVLFYSIPTSLSMNSFNSGILFFVILGTTLIMMIGSIWFTPREARREVGQEKNILAETNIIKPKPE